MSEAAYLGVDVGSTSVKAAVYTSNGCCLGAASLPSRSIRPRPGWSEQGHGRGVVAGRRGDAQGGRGGCRSIAAIGVSGQGDGLWGAPTWIFARCATPFFGTMPALTISFSTG